MTSLHHLFYFTCFILSAFGETVPCDLENESCITNAFLTIYNQIVTGIPALEIQSLDPLSHAANVTVELVKFRYSFTNGLVVGFKDCVVVNAKFQSGGSKFEFKLRCPSLTMTADYEVHGEVLSFNLNGQGHCSVTSDDIEFLVTADVEQNTVNNKLHINLKSFNLDFDVKGKVKYEFPGLSKDAKIGKFEFQDR